MGTGNLYNYFLKISIMLCKNIKLWCSNRAFLGQTYCSNHCNQQQQTCNNQLIRMNPVQSNPQICNSRCGCTLILPRYIRNGQALAVIFVLVCIQTFTAANHSIFCQYFPVLCLFNLVTSMCFALVSITSFKRTQGDSRLKYTFGNRLPLSQKNSNKIANPLNTCYWISTTLMCKNFCRWNIQQHNNKQKQNCQRSYVYQQLQKYKVLKPKKNLQTRTVQKKQYLIKNRVNRVFRAHYQKHTHQCTSCNQSKRLTHLLSSRGFEPLTIELKARCSTD